MTANRCIPVEEIYRALELPDQDPRRVHLRECPRCSALADQFRAFVEASAQDVDEARLVAAESSLKAALERELAAPARVSEWVEPAPATPGRTAKPEKVGNWWDAFLAPAWKPAFAFAAVIAVATALVVPRLIERPGEPVLRGAPAATRPVIVSAVRSARGVELRWQPVRGATSYEVRMYSTGLEEIGRVSSTETTLTLASDRIPAGARESTLLIRIAALEDGDELSVSEVRTIERR